MAFQPCPGTASVTLQFTTPTGDPAENILHVNNGSSSAWTAAQLTTLANGIVTALSSGGAANAVISNMQTGYTLSAVIARDLTTSGGPEVTVTATAAGGNASTAMPIGVTKAFTLRTGLAGRSNRGRLFQVGCNVNMQSSTDPNTMTTTTLTNLTAGWTALITAISGLGSGWFWCVLSRQNNLTKRANGVAVAITSVGYSHPQFDFQRRRAPLHGRHH